jgi:hypothetical protein
VGEGGSPPGGEGQNSGAVDGENYIVICAGQCLIMEMKQK